jgi:hypothetical protein
MSFTKHPTGEECQLKQENERLYKIVSEQSAAAVKFKLKFKKIKEEMRKMQEMQEQQRQAQNNRQ